MGQANTRTVHFDEHKAPFRFFTGRSSAEGLFWFAVLEWNKDDAARSGLIYDENGMRCDEKLHLDVEQGLRS